MIGGVQAAPAVGRTVAAQAARALAAVAHRAVAQAAAGNIIWRQTNLLC